MVTILKKESCSIVRAVKGGAGPEGAKHRRGRPTVCQVAACGKALFGELWPPFETVAATKSHMTSST
jgi:hypothetical protein